jgi:gas vesicle protein
MNEDSAKLAGAFLLGGLIGATIALLYAPKSGQQTRRDIAKTSRRLKEDAVDLVDDTLERVNDFAHEVKERVTDIIDTGIDLSESAKKEIIRTFDQGQKVIERQKNRIIDALGM